MPETKTTVAKSKKIATPYVRVDITKDLISDAVKNDSGHCMVAEAVKLAYPNAKNVGVDVFTIRFSDPKSKQRYIYQTPEIARVAIIRFDMGVKPEPFNFVLRGGQVVAQRPPSKHGKRTPAQIEALKKANATSPSMRVHQLLTQPVAEVQPAKRSRAKLQKTDKGPTSGALPTIVGGKAPPVQKVLTTEKQPRVVAASRVRKFGIRMFEIEPLATGPKVDVIE
jgi:hypothetical protein